MVRFPLRALLLVVALLATLCACNQSVDLSAVQTMSKQAAASSDVFNSVSADFYNSCLRGLQYENATFNVADCEQQKKASALWQTANAVLLSYVASLGALATNTQTDYGLGDLTSAIGGLKNSQITSDQQKAIVDAGSALFGDIFAAQRRDALAHVMVAAETPDTAHNCPNGCLIDLVNQLKKITTDDYVNTVLSAEDGNIDLFYDPNIARALATPRPPSPAPHATPNPIMMNLNSLTAVGRLVAFRYYSDKASAHEAVAKRRAAADTYKSALDQIVSTHHDIVVAIKDNRFDRILAIANSFAATYSAKLQEIQKAFQ